MARKDGHVVAGALARNPDDPGQVNAWTLYLATDDVDAATQRATAAGGVFFLGPLTVLDVGRIAVGADPAGAAYGLWQAKQHTGADLVDEPGALCWAETMSRNYDASRTFYADVFGYRLQEIGEGDFRYCVASLDDGRPVGGIGEIPAAAPADVPSHWMVYFAVESCDDAARRVAELGGFGGAAALRHPLRPDGGRRRTAGRDLLGHAPRPHRARRRGLTGRHVRYAGRRASPPAPTRGGGRHTGAVPDLWENAGHGFPR